jgi:hypothetical protein
MPAYFPGGLIMRRSLLDALTALTITIVALATPATRAHAAERRVTTQTQRATPVASPIPTSRSAFGVVWGN